MSPAILAFWIIVGLLAVWIFGGVVARLGGLLCTLAGVANLAVSPSASALLLIATGALIWLAGHWHFALRHQAYKSPLARHLFCRWAPGWLDPTRSWTTPVDSDNERRSR
jgi:hypothetical protein